jgi:hypothetical protein
VNMVLSIRLAVGATQQSLNYVSQILLGNWQFVCTWFIKGQR